MDGSGTAREVASAGKYVPTERDWLDVDRRVRRAVLHFAHGVPAHALDDAISAIVLAVFERDVPRFDPQRGTLAAFAGALIEKRLWRALRSLRGPDSLSIDDDDQPIEIADGNTTPADDMIARRSQADLDDLRLQRGLVGLTDRARRVMREKYVEGRTLAEIADGMGLDRAQTHRVHKHAIRGIRAQLRHRGFVVPDDATEAPPIDDRQAGLFDDTRPQAEGARL